MVLVFDISEKALTEFYLAVIALVVIVLCYCIAKGLVK